MVVCTVTARCRLPYIAWCGGSHLALTLPHDAQVRWEPAENGGRPNLVEVPNTTEVLEADLVLLAMGFLGPEATLAEALGIELDPRSNFKVCCCPGCCSWAVAEHLCYEHCLREFEDCIQL